jgi:hypothetical protein
MSVGAAYTWLSTEILSVDGLDDAAPPPFAVGDRSSAVRGTRCRSM